MKISRLRTAITAYVLLCYGVFLFGQERSLVIVPRENKRALLIGVNGYSEPITSLNYCVPDMKLLAESLEKIGFPKEKIILMIDDSLKVGYRPTKTNIEKQFKNLLGTVSEEDMIFIAFSGHGASNAGESFLCPGDTDPNRPETMISRQWIMQMMEESPAKHRIFLVDACRNEIFSGGAKSVSGTKSLDAEWGELPGVYLLSSCSPKQQSWEDPKLKQGVFTHFFVAGMSDSACDVNQDRNIDLMELFNYTRDKTIDHVLTTFNEPQRPTFKISGELSAHIVLASVGLEVKPKVEEKPSLPPSVPSAPSPAPKPPSPSVTMQSGSWGGSQAGDRKTLTIRGIDYAFRWCPAGRFMMGSPSDELGGESDEKPQHEVILTKGFWMLETEVTQGMWESVMGNNPSYFKGATLPVEQVSWDDSQDFTMKLNSLSGATPSGWKFSLPSEAQWEYACRAGSTAALNSGKNITSETGVCSNLAELGWYGKNSDSKTHAVSGKKANAWGLYDMHGNVGEWCLDWYGSYSKGSVTDPLGARSGTNHVLRGGSRSNNAGNCRSADRHPVTPDNRRSYFGFRPCLIPLVPPL